MTLNLHYSGPSNVKGGAIMQISHKDTNLDDSINLAETHPQKLLERILKLEDRVVLLELIQANIDKGSS
jgi:hypothetical protein